MTDSCLAIGQWNEFDQWQCDSEQADVVQMSKALLVQERKRGVWEQGFEGPEIQAALGGQAVDAGGMQRGVGVSSKYELHEQALSSILEDEEIYADG